MARSSPCRCAATSPRCSSSGSSWGDGRLGLGEICAIACVVASLARTSSRSRAPVPARGPAAGTHRPAHRPAEPSGPRGGDGRPRPRRPAAPRSSCSTSTASRRSTTASGIAPATICSAGSANGCGRRCAPATCCSASAATSSPSCCRTLDCRGGRRLRPAHAALVCRPVEIDGVPVQVGASLGVAAASDQATTIDELLHRADCAMYAAKSSAGRRPVVLGGREGARRRRRRPRGRRPRVPSAGDRGTGASSRPWPSSRHQDDPRPWRPRT